MKRRSGKKKSATTRPRNRRQVAVAIGIALSLLVAGVAMAHRGSLFVTRNPAASSPPQGQLSLAKEYVYAGGRLLATEEPPSPPGCGTPLSPPGSLVATAQSTTSVVLTWGASSGADHYEVQRTSNIALPSGGWVPLSPNPTTNAPFPDNGLAENTTYIYRVRAFADAAGACPSAFSEVDIATTIIFTEDLVPQSTTIKAVHISQLRTAVNKVRVAAGLQPVSSWFEDPLQQFITTVKAQHITELRSNLNPARTEIGMSAIQYVDPTLTQFVTQIKAIHVQQLRDGVK